MHFVDCFRNKHLSDIYFKYLCPNGKSRKDKIFISKNLEQNFHSIIHKPYVFSDHLAVILILDSFNNLPISPKYKTKWKLNTFILTDTAFKNTIEDMCNEAKKNKKQCKNFFNMVGNKNKTKP